MPTISFQYDTDAERLELERAAAYVSEMRQLGRTAAYGTVLEPKDLHPLLDARIRVPVTLARNRRDLGLGKRIRGTYPCSPEGGSKRRADHPP